MGKLTSNLSNAFSTGGGGYEFERKVQAIFLLGLVIKGFSPVLNSRIVRVSFQTKREGWNTDDLLVIAENGEKLLCQMKHDLTVTDKNNTFQQVINAAWADFKNAGFKQGKDKIALITGFIAKDSIDALRRINETALTDISANGFITKIQQANYSNKTVSGKLDVIKKCLQKANGNTPVTDDELWQFCKSFVLLVFDVDFINGVNECLVKSLINCKSSVNASLVWAKLQEVASYYNRTGAEITLDNLDEEILEYFGLNEQNKQTNLQISGFVPDEFMAKLALLGSWDENNSYDRTVVEELYGITYNNFEKRVQKYLVEDNEFISLSNGIWKVKHRKQLFERCDKHYFDKTIEKVFSITDKILKQRDKRFSSGKEVNSFFSGAKNFDNSEVIRKSLVIGLCILSNSCVLKNCSKDKVLREGETFIRNLFKDCDWTKLISLKELIYSISEISPKTYLKELEKYIERDPHGVEKLFPTKQSLWFSDNYICYLLWSIEVLAWHEDYLIGSIRCLGELSSLNYDETNQSNTSIRSIISILLPWYPQTLASEQKQLNAIQLLVKEYPDIGWEVLKGLLPNSATSMATPTVKPKFLNIVIPEKVDVKNEQLYCVYDSYFSLALEIASSDAQKISELIGCISYVGAEAIRKFLTTVQKYSDTWTDSQRLKVWLKLCDYKYDVIFQNNNTEPESELFLSLCDTITKLTPEDCFSKNKRLFLCDNNEFTLRMDDDNYWQKLTEAKQLAVKEIFETYGIEGVYRFGNETGKGNEIFYDFGRLLKIEELSTVLAKYSEAIFSPDFVYNTIEGFIIVNGIASLEKIGLQNYSVELTVNILTQIRYFSDGLLKVVHNLLSDNEDLFWGKYSIPVYYYSDCDYDIQYVVDRFIKNGRFNFLANMLGKGRDVAPIKEEVVYEILEKAATTKQSDSLDPYAVQHLIKRLQDSENRDIDRLSGIELFYLPWLDIHSRTHPRALKTKIAESPEFFCQIIELTFKKHNSDDYIKVNEAAAQRLVQIVFRFDVVPGTDWNGIFNVDKFKSWIDYVIDWSLKNDREVVTKQTIGNGLSYAKPLDNNIIDEEIIKVLDAKENAEMRKGYQIGMFNQRGVYIVDPEGKPEKTLAAKFEGMADSVEEMGYSRFSDTLRDIAQNYLYEAEHNIQSEKLRKGTDD